MDSRPEAVAEDADQFDDHVVRELFALSMGLQGLVQVQARQENRIRLAGYVDRLDLLIRRVRAGAADDFSGDDGVIPETLSQRLLRTAEDESVVLGLPVHVEFRGRLDFSTELSDRVVLVARGALHNVACHANASSALAGQCGGRPRHRRDHRRRPGSGLGHEDHRAGRPSGCPASDDDGCRRHPSHLDRPRLLNYGGVRCAGGSAMPVAASAVMSMVPEMTPSATLLRYWLWLLE